MHPAPSPTYVTLDAGVRLVTPNASDVVSLAVLAAGRIGAELDVPVAVVQADQAQVREPEPLDPAEPRGPGEIRLRLAEPSALGLPSAQPAHAQGFALTIAQDGIDVAAPTPTGLAHAVATLVRLAAEGRSRADRAAGRPPRLPVGTLRDHPWLAWRGIAVDLAHEPLAAGGLAVLLNLMSSARLDVLRLPAAEDAYDDVLASATTRQITVVPGTTTSPDRVRALVTTTRAAHVDVGGATDPTAARARAEAALAAGATPVVDQAAAAAVVGLPAVLVVHDPVDPGGHVARAVAAGARVVLAVPRLPTERPLMEAAVTVDRAVAALELPARALLGVEGVPAWVGGAAPDRPDPLGGLVGTAQVGTLLPWMSAIAEVGWTSPA